MNATTITSRAATGLVAGVAGYASFTHIYAVASRAGEHVSVAAVIPLSIDGLIVVGTLAMLEDKRAGRRPRLSARLAVAFGVVATLAANIASAHPTTTARLVAAVPPLAFLIAIEVLSRRGRELLAEPAAVEPVDEPVADPAPEPVERITPKRVKPRSLTAEQRVAAAHEKQPAATHEQIAKRAAVSVSTVKRYRPSGSPSAPAPAPTPAVERVNGNVPELSGVAR